MKKTYLCLLLFSALMFTAVGQTRIFNGGTDNLFSTSTNWKDGLLPTLLEITQINQSPTTVTVDADYSQSRLQTNLTRITDLLISGTNTLTIDTQSTNGTFGSGNAIAINHRANNLSNLVIDCPITIANSGTGKWSRVDVSGTTSGNTIDFGVNSILNIEKLKSNLGFWGTEHNYLFNGTISGTGDIGIGTTATFSSTFDRQFTGYVYLESPANVTVNSTSFLDGSANARLQAESSATVTLNTPNVFINEPEISSRGSGTNLTLNVNANQTNIGVLRTSTGATLTINLDSSVTEFSCKAQNFNAGAWAGSVVINGFREGVVRFGTSAAGLTAGELALISTDAAGKTIVVGPDGYLYFDTTYIFSGSWNTDPGVTAPTASSNLIIQSGNPLLGGAKDTGSTTTFGDITIAPGAGLRFNAGNSLTASSVTMESTSTEFSTFIINNPPAALSLGDFKYKRYVSQTGASGGTNDLISSPVAGQTFGGFASDPDNSNLSASGTLRAFAPFDKSTGTYTNYDAVADASMVIESGVGYRVATDDGSLLTFTGNMPLDNLSIPISFVTGTPSGHWHLIGNPFPAYLNLGKFLTANTAVMEPSYAAVYGYNAASVNSNHSSWTVWDSNTPDNLIAPGQGFYVASNAAGGNISLTRTMRASGGGDDFISGRIGAVNLAQAKINISSGSKRGVTNLYFRDINTRGLDPGYDTGAYATDDFGVYSRLVEDNQGIDFYNQSLAYSDLNDVIVPLSVHTIANEAFSISIDLSSTVPAGTYVYLEDTTQETLTLLSTGEAYRYTPTDALSGSGRYFLRFSASALDVHSETLKGLEIFAVNRTLHINGVIDKTSSVMIYDLQGRQVSFNKLESSQPLNTLDLSHFTSGLYIVSVRSRNQQLTQKIIIK